MQDVLAETGLEPRYLELELTESLLMQNTQDAAAKLSSLRQLGVAAAIDDFGTGYSSLAYLRRLPIDTLKIDRSFVNDIIPGSGDDSGTAVIRAILSMARSLNLQVVAEGVETPEQRDFLTRAGCQLYARLPCSAARNPPPRHRQDAGRDRHATTRRSARRALVGKDRFLSRLAYPLHNVKARRGLNPRSEFVLVHAGYER